MVSLLVPPVALLAMLAIAASIMVLAKRMAPRGEPSSGKYRPYACGEDMEMPPIQPDYSGFFAVALAYSIVHVSVLTVATTPAGEGARLGAIYLAMMAFALGALVTELKLV